MQLPFWPATSLLDIPVLVFLWQDAEAEAEAKAQPEIERQRKVRAVMADYHPPVVRAN